MAATQHQFDQWDTELMVLRQEVLKLINLAMPMTSIKSTRPVTMK